MTTTDLFAADFPHGTAEGYTRGCHGNGACPGRYEAGRTCAQAYTRSRGEFHRTGVAESPETEAVTARYEQLRDEVPERVISPITGAALLQRAEAEVLKPMRAKPAVAAAEKPAVKNRGGRPAGPLVHGTRYGYERGCRDPQTCPRGEDGRSCTQAAREYQRESNRKRAAELARLRGEPEPKRRKTRNEESAPPTTPEPEPRAVQTPAAERALVNVAELVADIDRALTALTTATAAIREINHHLNTYKNGGQ